MDRQTDTERGDNDAGNWLVAWLHHFPQPGMLLLLECMVTTSALAHNPSACPTLAINNIVVFGAALALLEWQKVPPSKRMQKVSFDFGGSSDSTLQKFAVT